MPAIEFVGFLIGLLLAILMLEVWLSEYLPRAQAGEPAPARPSPARAGATTDLTRPLARP